MIQSMESTPKRRIGHWVRVPLMFCNFFIFPHAMTEDDDIGKYHADKDARVKKE